MTVKEFRSQNSGQSKRQAKSLFDEELKTLIEKGKVVNENDSVNICDKKKNVKKIKKDKKRKRDSDKDAAAAEEEKIGKVKRRTHIKTK